MSFMSMYDLVHALSLYNHLMYPMKEHQWISLCLYCLFNIYILGVNPTYFNLLSQIITSFS